MNIEELLSQCFAERIKTMPEQTHQAAMLAFADVSSTLGIPVTFDSVLAQFISKHVGEGENAENATKLSLEDMSAVFAGLPISLPKDSLEVLVRDVQSRIDWWREQQAKGRIPVAPGIVAEVVSPEEYERRSRSGN